LVFSPGENLAFTQDTALVGWSMKGGFWLMLREVVLP
jgi:hypothetical protein